MPRYFLELSYKGTNYSGFQVQENAKTIQSEVETALHTLYRQPFQLTGSSRTDAGVHALSNFFHFDTPLEMRQRDIYNLNAILPADIAATAYYAVDAEAHSRFGAVSRQYQYCIYNSKNPFLNDRGWYYPFKIEESLLHFAAGMVQEHHHFIAFSKRNTQVNNFNCSIELSNWTRTSDGLIYNVRANRFLRGMVRGLVATMLKLARGTIDTDAFGRLLESQQQATADFSAPAHGLCLTSVNYPQHYMQRIP